MDIEEQLHQMAEAEYCRQSDEGLIDLYYEYSFDLWIEGSGKLFMEEQRKILESQVDA